MDGVTVIAAVLNEGENISAFMQSLNDLDVVKELVVVDDGSSDSTVQLVQNFKGRYAVKLLQRDHKMGTVSAQIAGAQEATSEYVIIMDADLQHDPSLIKRMYDEILKGKDVVIASRLADGGMSKRHPVRGLVSRGANFLAHLFIPQSRGISDVMSGFLVVRRQIVASLPPIRDSYKILLYIFASNKRLRYREIPYKFLPRLGGESKVVSGFDFLLTYIVELMHYVRVEFKAEANGYV